MSFEIAALFVETNGCYFNLPHVDCWDINRDARLYTGPHPVVAHPPCQLWGRFAHVNYKRWGGEHNKPGNDNGCFHSAIFNVYQFGGVLEHPAYSDAWKIYSLPRPIFGKWKFENDLWVTEVWQSAYGHKARKKTWLCYHGRPEPLGLKWDKIEGEYQIGFHDQRGYEANKPTVSGKEASRTPIEFRDTLLNLARLSVCSS
jgi:hypothetical protein